MLANAFKTAAELELSDAEFEALFHVLGMLERGDLVHVNPRGIEAVRELTHFNMGWVRCQTVGCIAGWARQVSGGRVFEYFGWFEDLHKNLRELLYPTSDQTGVPMYHITPAQAAVALRNYLTHGEPRWSEALAA